MQLSYKLLALCAVLKSNGRTINLGKLRLPAAIMEIVRYRTIFATIPCDIVRHVYSCIVYIGLEPGVITDMCHTLMHGLPGLMTMARDRFLPLAAFL